MSTKTLKISEETKERLDPLRHPGQSWDGILQELAELGEKAGKENVDVHERLETLEVSERGLSSGFTDLHHRVDRLEKVLHDLNAGKTHEDPGGD